MSADKGFEEWAFMNGIVMKNGDGNYIDSNHAKFARAAWLASRKAMEADLAGRKANLDETAKDADAAMLYGSTARGHGFIGVPKWSELAEETKALYRNAIAAKEKP